MVGKLSVLGLRGEREGGESKGESVGPGKGLRNGEIE